MIYYFDSHSPDRFTQLLFPGRLIRQGCKKDVVSRWIHGGKSSVESVVCSSRIVMRFLYERSVATKHRSLPTLLILRASFPCGPFIINSMLATVYSTSERTAGREKLMRFFRLADVHECIVSTSGREIYCRHRTVSPRRTNETTRVYQSRRRAC